VESLGALARLEMISIFEGVKGTSNCGKTIMEEFSSKCGG
jgi:hypothetical protein